MNRKRLGFSLIELSIVILIIGILVIGISKGSRIITSSRLSSARSLTTSSPVNSSPDLILWLETSLKTSFDSSIATGAGVANWYDNNMSTTKNNAAQSNAAYQPTYRENIVNGLPALTFDVVNDHIIVPNFELRNAGRGGYTYFMVMSKTQTGRGDPFILKQGDGSQDDFGLITEFGKVLYFSKVNGVTEIIGVAGAATVDNRFFIVSVVRNNSSIYTGYVNGAQDYTTTVTADMTGIDMGTPLYLGSNHDGSYAPTLPFGGYITEVIVFNRALKVQERKDIEQYLGKKYNIKVI